MRGIFVQPLTVPAEAIDTNGHVNNLDYLKWMQEVAIRHSDACGWPAERSARAGATWVIRSHFIEYLRPAFAGESLCLLTWLAALNPRSAPRRYLFWRDRDRKIVAKAGTLFVYVQAATGRPLRIPDELKDAFDVIADEAEVLRTLGGDPPGPVVGASSLSDFALEAPACGLPKGRLWHKRDAFSIETQVFFDFPLFQAQDRHTL